MRELAAVFGGVRFAGPLLLGGALLLASPDPGGAGVLLRQDYAKAPVASGAELVRAGGREGYTVRKGAHEDFVKRGAQHSKAGLYASAGAAQILVTPLRYGSNDVLLEIAGAFQIRASWEEGGRSLVVLRGADSPDNQNTTQNGRAWGGRSFPMALTDPQPGEWHVVTVTWGRNPDDNRVYVDEREIEPVDFDAAAKRAVAFTKRNPDVFVGRSDETWGRGSNVDSRGSLIGGVALYDHALTQEEVAASAAAWISGVDDTPPALTAISNNAARVAGFSGRLVAGDQVKVNVEGTPGGIGTFDIVHYPDVGGKIDLDWSGWGVYLEEKPFREKDEVDLRDVNGYRVFASQAPFDPGAPGMEPVAELKVEEQKHTLELLDVDKPYYVAVVAVMRDGSLRPVIAPIANRPMVETSPGVYGGSYTVGWQDRYPRAVAVGRLARAKAAVELADTKYFAIDPALTIAVKTDPDVLKADEKSVANVAVTVTNANGNPVSGHKIRFVLATTSQYTGVVGGGAFTDQVGGTMSESRWGETDLFGRLTTTYKAGFAAKTAIIVARDMLSNDTGAGYVKTYIQATAELELEPFEAMRAMDAGYVITVTSSDEWLTADGRSQARITAKVTLGGQPVEGHRVSFNASGLGTIRSVKDTTGRDGEARAVFTAGKKIGIVLITATDTTVGISGSVQIELRSDAPAKIAIKIKPERLPADGRSRADLQVLVTDINDNPNDNTEVEYRIAAGSGRLRDEKTITDRNGESSAEYTAGTTPGKVTFELTVRSMQPTDEELAKARGFALAVTDYKFY